MDAQLAQHDYGPTKPSGYKPRLVDARIQRFLRIFGAVEVRGAKWCGKTWAALAFGHSATHVDDPNVRPLIEADPSLALAGDQPHVVDEWQEVPGIWDTARHAIDAAGGRHGLYILTGSSTPAKDKVSHSGAGRIGRISMSTMSLFEQGMSSGEVSLKALFDHRFAPAAIDGTGLHHILDAICRGGWPALAGATPQEARDTISQYLEALFEISVPQRGGTPYTARRIAASLARNVASNTTLSTLAADAQQLSPQERGQADTSTVRRYLDIFSDLFFIEELTGWDAPIRSRSRLTTKPKRYFADPSLPATLLGCTPERLLTDSQTTGLLFESLCIHDLKALLMDNEYATEQSLHYYRDADGLEVDLIVELADGRWAGIEIKLGENKVPEAMRNLNRLRDKIAANPAARNPQPEFMAVLTGNSPFARYDREHDVYVFPLTALRP